MNSSSFVVRAFVFASLATAAIPFSMLAGCGSGVGSSIVSGGAASTPTPTPSVPASSRRYFASTFTVTNGDSLFITLSAAADGTVSGTVSVSEEAKAVTRAVIGMGNVTGNINLSTGVVDLNGSYTVNGVTTPIRVTGTVPAVAGTSGQANLILANTTYTAQWVVSTTAPITSNGNNGGNASGGSSALTFSGNSSNITAGNLNAAAGIGTKQTLPFVGDVLTVNATDIVNGKPRVVSIVFTGTTPTLGATYDLASSNDVAAGYVEGTNPLKGFEATGGTIKVTAISGSSYTFTLTGVSMTALIGNPINIGTGGFTVNGTLTATLP
jgi:hypothetical protein